MFYCVCTWCFNNLVAVVGFGFGKVVLFGVKVILFHGRGGQMNIIRSVRYLLDFCFSRSVSSSRAIIGFFAPEGTFSVLYRAIIGFLPL